MFRPAFISLVLFSFLPGALAQTPPQDYSNELMKLTSLTDAKNYREAISGYKNLEGQPATPSWLKAASEYEIAELYAALREPDNAIAALGRAVQLGFDDCLTPRTSERLASVVQMPAAKQTLARMQLAEGDFRELVWLKSEVQHAEHDARMMITENINRLDHHATEIPQAQLPTRATNSAAVLYWRQQLLLMQRAQRQFVQKSDIERMTHATKMAIISGGKSPSAALESARRAQATAASRKMEISRRAFVPITPASNQPKSCSEWK
jgi:tetratricopeptide (TPR) repeat protein